MPGMAFQRPIGTPTPRLISAAIASEMPDEDFLLANSYVVARLLARRSQAIIVFPDRVMMYSRNSVPVPESDDDAAGGAYFDPLYEIVSATNSRYLGSLVSAAVMFYPGVGEEMSWVRVVGLTSGLDTGNFTFGLTELSLSH